MVLYGIKDENLIGMCCEIFHLKDLQETEIEVRLHKVLKKVVICLILAEK